MDGDTRINGATFAIYTVEENADGIFFDNNGDIVTPIDGDYTVNGENGIITSTTGEVIATPIAVTTTATMSDNIHVGTGEFVNLNDGKYIIKEIKSPPGYALNDTNIMVLVTEDTIYANAGTEEDGVTVGRGPGYVVNTLNHFASQDEIDNTLTWIYAKMKISMPSTSFNDVKNPIIKGYISKNESSETVPDVDSAGVFKTYLMYKPSEAVAGGQVAFNYYPNKEKHNESDELAQYRRIFTTSGWPYYEIHQDYDWGKQHKISGANYEDWRAYNITNLFSRSTYVRVTDKQDVSLTVKKINSENNQVLFGAQFVLYRKTLIDEAETVEYYKLNDDGTTAWVTDKADAMIAISNSEGKLDKIFAHIEGGTYYLEEIKAPAGFVPLAHSVKVEINYDPAFDATATLQNAEGTNARTLERVITVDEATNHYTIEVTVSNFSGHELPQTGGYGTEVYTVAGISIIALVLVLAMIKKRKTA